MSSSLLNWIFFKFLAFFRHVSVVSYLQIQQTKNRWIIAILLNHFYAIFKVSRPVAFETETRKHGSQDESDMIRAFGKADITRRNVFSEKHSPVNLTRQSYFTLSSPKFPRHARYLVDNCHIFQFGSCSGARWHAAFDKRLYGRLVTFCRNWRSMWRNLTCTSSYLNYKIQIV